ncbi:MAG: hypothetical protein KJ697_00670 [Nanoarchaeota archaeon]|nr:hypothetical protein [Nanoarchaeota archaeon]
MKFTLNEISPRTFHLNDFPEHMYVYLEDCYRRKLFKALINIFGNKNKLSKFFGIDNKTLIGWYNGNIKQFYDGKIHKQYIPLNKLLIISNVLVLKKYNEFAIEKLEKKVKMYRVHSGTPIQNPKIPLKESNEIISILVHLIGDGSAEPNQTPCYSNTRTELLDKFETELKVFGDFKVIRNNDKIYFPTTIADILRHIYKISFNSKTARIPDILKHLPKSYSATLIKSFLDDEGSIGDGRINFHSINIKLLEDIRQLLAIKFPSIAKHTCEITTSGVGSCFYIKIGGIEEYRNLIGLTHEKRRVDLDWNIERMHKNKNGVSVNPRWVTKGIIIDKLKAKSSTIKEMSRSLGVRYITTQQHFRDLKNEDIIYTTNRTKEGQMWCVK